MGDRFDPIHKKTSSHKHEGHLPGLYDPKGREEHQYEKGNFYSEQELLNTSAFYILHIPARLPHIETKGLFFYSISYFTILCQQSYIFLYIVTLSCFPLQRKIHK